MDFGITANGFVMRRLDQIYGDSCERFKSEAGFNPSENPQSIANVMFTIFSDAPAELWEAFAFAYQQLSPLTAIGLALDHAMQLGGLSRIGKSRTKYSLACTGREGTVIPVGALVQSNTFPQRRFQAKAASTISSANWNVLKIQPIQSIAGSFEFTFDVTRNATSGAVGSISETSSITKNISVTSYSDAFDKILEILQGFDSLSKFGITVKDETDESGIHSIVLSASGASDSFSSSICRYITVVDVTSNILFESSEYGSFVLANGTITEIVSTVDGWTSCTNLIAPIKGRLTQTDAEARTSYQERVALRGQTTVDSIVSALYSNVDGVTFADGYQNDNDDPDEAGRPPHCIEIVVQGGLDEDVANTIWTNKSGGINTHGTYYAYATDTMGRRQYVEFTRVKDVYLLLSVKITSSEGLDNDFESRVKKLLMDEAFRPGTSVKLQGLIRPIMVGVSGVDFVEILGLLSESPDIEGVLDDSMKSGVVPVGIDQQPVLTMNGIRVVKT